jgi:threonine-phosphate decarboxylase
MLERYGHGGDVWSASELYGKAKEAFIDYSSNMNPWGPPTIVKELLENSWKTITSYPDPAVRELRHKLAESYSIPADSILVGNGAAELIDLVIRLLEPNTTGLVRPSFSEYEEAVAKINGQVLDIPVHNTDGFELQFEAIERALAQADILFLGHPNNPTGRLVPSRILERIMSSGKPLILDEAFIDFVPEEERVSLIRQAAESKNIYVIRSMTKFYAIPGIRLGFMVAHPEIISRLHKLQTQWSVNSIAQQIGAAVLDDRSYAAKTKQWLLEERAWFTNQLKQLKLEVYPSETNFLLCELPKDKDLNVKILQNRLGQRGILIRDASLFKGLDERYFRLAVRLRADNELLISELKLILGVTEAAAPILPPTALKLAATIMIQGTSSDVGKSILTAALCRIFLEDGWRVAPFKSQNMSLNSYVTPDGKEIGRAQGMQADASRTAATTDMNPILLKPKGEMTSQVIVHGKPYRDLDFRTYREAYAEEAELIVKEALLRLRGHYEIVVIEGAGSPAEVNLKDRDIVNMRLARWADAPVLLVADIDRGGVFASIVGTLEILLPEEQARVRGFIINKFRGDVSLLQPGLDWLEAKTGKPVIGVIPFLPNIQLEDEDSASLDNKIRQQTNAEPSKDKLTINVIRLPRISNFTDFDPLLEELDVTIRYISNSMDWGNPDAVILPGSKNTVEDLLFLHETGLAALIIQYVENEGSLIGICGGYQMMGERLLDPLLVESNKLEVAGLGLLPLETTFIAEKKTERVEGVAISLINKQPLPIEGYEIHMGRTRFTAEIKHPFQIRLTRQTEVDGHLNAYHPEGVISADGKLWGTYIHGILHNDDFRRSWLNQLRLAKGWQAIESTVKFQQRREAAFERLAEHVRKHLDLAKIYEMIPVTKGGN